MTARQDRATAESIRDKWHELAHSYDANIARADVRTILAAASWSDATFDLLRKGLRHALDAAGQRQFLAEYGWAVCREAYDFSIEPTYQYSLLAALLGIWRDSPSDARRAEIFEGIVVRQTLCWTLSGWRCEPLGINLTSEKLALILIPFAWNDLLQLSIGSWLDCLGVDRASSLADVARIVNSEAALHSDWSCAHATWNGLVARSVVGTLHLPHVEEAAVTVKLCASDPALQPFISHQSGPLGQDLGNTLTHIASVYTIAHEAGHIISDRLDRRLTREPAAQLEKEQKADELAMGAIWNEGFAIAPEVRPGQDFETLWFASGLFFYFGVIVGSNLARSVATVEKWLEASPPPDSHWMTRPRFRAWLALASQLAAVKSSTGDTSATVALATMASILPSLVAYSNAMLDYAREVAPGAMDTARRMNLTSAI